MREEKTMRQIERINEILYSLKGYKKMILMDSFININDPYYTQSSLYQNKKLIKRQNKNNNKLVNTKRK